MLNSSVQNMLGKWHVGCKIQMRKNKVSDKRPKCSAKSTNGRNAKIAQEAKFRRPVIISVHVAHREILEFENDPPSMDPHLQSQACNQFACGIIIHVSHFD